MSSSPISFALVTGSILRAIIRLECVTHVVERHTVDPRARHRRFEAAT
jgi:hypothetical protein